MALQPLLHVMFFLSIMCVTLLTGLFNNVFTENGDDHYAEKTVLHIPGRFVIKMPLNTLVNFGYALVGIMWLYKIDAMVKHQRLPSKHEYKFCVFNWMATAYGFVQLSRILTQKHELAVLDQWVTLPFFSWVIVWALDLEHGRNDARDLAVIVFSILGYLLALVHKQGFELALAIHIIATISAGMSPYLKCKNPGVTWAFWGTILSCCGFVGLKLLDHQLAALHFGFQYISGHFLSKICDILQIHCANKFFLNIIQEFGVLKMKAN